MANKRYTIAIKLREMIGWDQAEYVPEDARRLIIDWIILDDIIEANLSEATFLIIVSLWRQCIKHWKWFCGK